MKSLKFRPREGWRVFVGEVGVIVLGVLIALVAQQVAEDWQWQQTVERTKADLDAQIAYAIASSAERVAVEPCLTQRLSELAGKVAASRGDWKGDVYALPGEASAGVRYAIPRVYRTPNRTYEDDVWQQAKAGGVLSHMTPEDITQYSNTFNGIKVFESLREPETSLQAELSFLAFDGPLNPSDRARALSSISQLDTINKEIVNNVRQMVERAKELGVSFSPANKKWVLFSLERQAKLRGSCVDRAAALKVTAPLRAKPGQ